jgi:hypothetical protein
MKEDDMGKFGWDLPPGCSVSDIPGNRPEDLRREALEDKIWDALEKSGLTHGPSATSGNCERAQTLLYDVCGAAYQEGRADGAVDEALALGMIEPSREELIAALRRAEVQLKSGYLNRTDAEAGTEWIREILEKEERRGQEAAR